MLTPVDIPTSGVSNQEMPHFGKTIERLRKKANLSQEELAAIAGLSRGTIQNIEKSEDRKVRGSSYRRLAEALGIKTHDLDREWGGRETAYSDEFQVPGTDMAYAQLRTLAEDLKWRPELLVERLIMWFSLQPRRHQEGLLESPLLEKPRLQIDKTVEDRVGTLEDRREQLKEAARAARKEVEVSSPGIAQVDPKAKGGSGPTGGSGTPKRR